VCQDIGDTELEGVPIDLGRYLVEAHLLEARPVAELARAHGVHRSWIYKLLARYRTEGEAGLERRSRRPRSSPRMIRDLYEIVALRKELTDAGFDAGAQTISFHLAQRHENVTSVPSIWRVLRERRSRRGVAARLASGVHQPARLVRHADPDGRRDRSA
jgi:transposase